MVYIPQVGACESEPCTTCMRGLLLTLFPCYFRYGERQHDAVCLAGLLSLNDPQLAVGRLISRSGNAVTANRNKTGLCAFILQVGATLCVTGGRLAEELFAMPGCCVM
jgi:hypothetical protein